MVVGDLIYLGSCAGRFLALDKATGDDVWSYDITQDGEQTSFHGDPLITDSLIITGADGRGIGHLYAFSLSTGAMRWMLPDKRGYSTDLIRHGALFYAASRHDELACLEIETGQLVWSESSPSDATRPFSSSPAIACDRVFFGNRDGIVKALSADSGHVLWTTDVRARVGTAILADADNLYLGTARGYLYRLAQSDGHVLDSLYAGETTERAATIGNMALTDSVLIVLRDGGKELIGVDRSLDSILWRLESETIWSSYRPHLWRDMVLIGDEEGTFCAVDPSTGAVEWTEEFEGMIRGIGSDGNRIFIGTLQGMVYAWEWTKQAE